MTASPQNEQINLTDLQNNNDNIDFAYMRKKDNANYRNLCRSFVKMIDPPNLEKLAIFIIKKSGDRYEEEVSILHKWTQRFKFFQELNAKQSNVDLRIHEKCCMKMKYEKIEKGKQVFMAGDIPEKFYIILNGSVNVLLQKSQEVLQQEIQKSQEQYKKYTSKDQSNSIQARVKRLIQKRMFIKKLEDTQREFDEVNEMNGQKEQILGNVGDNKEDNSQVEFEQEIEENSSDKIQTFSEQIEELNRKNQKQSQNQKRDQSNKRHNTSTLNQNDDSQVFLLGKNNDIGIKKISTFNDTITPSKKQTLFNQESQQLDLTNQLFLDSSSPFKRNQSRAQTKLSELHQGSILQKSSQYSAFSPQNLQLDSKKKQESLINPNFGLINNDLNKYSQQNQQTQQIQQNAQRLNLKFEDLQENQRKDSQRESPRKSVANNLIFDAENQINDFQDIDPNQKDLENDPLYIGLGQIKLSDLSDPQKFIQDGVLKHTYLLTLETGQMFGELGLLMKKPRAATIIAKVDTEFAVLDAQDYIQILQAGEMKKFNRRINFFSSSLLQNCGREVVVKFSYNFEKYKFEKGQYIYSQDDQPKFVYLIKKGTVQIQKKLEVCENIEDVFDYGYKNPKQEKRKELKHLKQQKQFIDIIINEYTVGQSFGEMEVMYQCPRSCSVICTSLTSTIYALSIKNFLVLLQENKFLVKDFQKQINMKEDFQKNKIKLYLESIRQQNEINKQHVQERERIIIKNRKFNKQKENPTHFDTVFKPSVTEFNFMDSLIEKRQNTEEETPFNQNQALNQKMSNSSSPQRTHQHQYSPSQIQKKCYINEQGNRQIDVSEELFENSAFQQFLQQLIKIKQQKLKQFMLSKQNDEKNINNTEIFTTMLYIQQIKKQIKAVSHEKYKPGIVKLKKILHQSGLDLKDTINLELLLQGDEQIKQAINSPLNSSRSISLTQKSPKKQDQQDTSDYVNEILSSETLKKQNNFYNTSDFNDNSPSSRSSEYQKLIQGGSGNRNALNNSNNIEVDGNSEQSSPINQYYIQDWQQFMKKYNDKLKSMKSLEKKSPSIKKVYSNAVSDRFFQETLQNKKLEQRERKSFLQNLQSSFENSFQTERDQFQYSMKDISRDSYLFSTTNSKDCKKLKKLKQTVSQSIINDENSLIQPHDDDTKQNQSLNLRAIHRDSFEQSSLIKNKIINLDELNKIEETRKVFFSPNKLPKIEQTSDQKCSSSFLENKQSLNLLKSQSITLQKINQNGQIKSPQSQILQEDRGKSPSQIIQQSFSIKNRKRLSFENNFIQSKINLQKQASIQIQDNQQMNEYYVNSQYVKPSIPSEVINNNTLTNRQTNLSQFNSTTHSKKNIGQSFIAKIDLGCGFSNSLDHQQINSSIEEQNFKGKPQNPSQIIKILSKIAINTSVSPSRNMADSNVENKQFKKNNMSISDQNMTSKNQSSRILINSKSYSQDKKNISIQIESNNKDLTSNQLPTNQNQPRGEYLQEGLLSNINSQQDNANPQVFYINEVKKSLSLSSKHSMFRTKPSKLFLIDRYTRDSKINLSNPNGLKPINHLIDMQIKKLKLHHQQGQNINHQ